MRYTIALLAAIVIPTLSGRCEEVAPAAPATNPPVEAAPAPEPEKAAEEKPLAPPALSITKAAELAEGELGKLGLAQTHFVRALNFQPETKAGAARYTVRIEPPLPVSGSTSERARTNLAVFMDGSVKMVTIENSPRRVKRIVQ
jgi:hypothetical protein